MTDEPDTQEMPDVYDRALECGAHRLKPGSAIHSHICRQYPEHVMPHVCHACGATWSAQQAAA